MRKGLRLAIPLTFLLLTSLPPCGFAQETPSILVYNKDATQQEPQLEAMIHDNDWAQWTVRTSGLSREDLDDKTHLLLYNSRHDLRYTQDEIESIERWFDEGGKTLWVTSDSDFFSNNGRIASANQVLEAIGSRLRAESASVRDPVNNAEPAYRVLASPNTEDTETVSIVEGVETVLVSGPSPIIGYLDGRYRTLEDAAYADIHVILKSRSTSEIVDNTGVPPEAHTRTSGEYCVMAMELIPSKRNIVIVSGESPFAQGEGIYKPETYYRSKYTENYPQQGAALVNSLLQYTTEVEWPEQQSEAQSNIPVPVISVVAGLIAVTMIKHLKNRYA